MSQTTRPGVPGAIPYPSDTARPRSPARNQGFLAFFLATRKRSIASLPLASIAQIFSAAAGAWALAWFALSSVSEEAAFCIGAGACVLTLLLGLRHARRELARANATAALARALLDANRECLKLIGPDGRMLRISEHGAEIMQASSPEQLAGANWLGFWSGDDARAARTAFDAAMSGSRASFVGACPTTAGVPKTWQSRLIPIDDGRGGVRDILCASLDVTQEAELAADLRAKELLMSEMEAHVGLCFYSYSADYSYFHHVSAGCASVFGIEAKVLRERPQAWVELVLPDDRPELLATMQRITQSKDGGRARYRIEHPVNGVRWIQSTGYPILDANGNVVRVVGISEDVTVEHERLAELDRLAFSDSLTGLANRGALVLKIEERCQRNAAFALMFIDLDRFKVLNDTLGHTAADRLLKSLSELIQAALPPDALLARLGGDEFAVLIDDAADKTRLARIAKDILAALARSGEPSRADAFVTASIGISVFPENGADHETLLTSADIAMYAAKKAGRNGFSFADANSTERIVDFKLERDLPAALANRQFLLHYQAIHEPRTLEVRSVEALIRWKHPTRGLVSPGVFIPILEESGFINEIGAWVMDEALRQLALWRHAGARSLGVSVNVSSRQLRDEAIVEVVNDALHRYELPASSLEVELTESALMENPARAQRTLSALKALGVRIAIDDFGTGYSSLRYLADFSPDTLKIDRSFVARLQDDRATQSIVGGIIQMARALGVSVTAEGVEQTVQLEFLRDAACDRVQGFLLSQPVAPEKVLGLSIAAPE
ncbi:putative bifunctional diguanylate cyclase/phosphodiesterase [Caballeronia concitans]|uniref:Diguanylate cyclase/phosphodiesterase with PAS/PAC sensor(S) n=1 Tax=Caballeronia concitans TaxID=1777133 RepID=A0A658QUV9_9BURK|nr:EAL domain-containing protein [Caballeronia concitans]KIG10898.1 diguanylate cyclase/phosphodiesterase with PAS/PAC sensor(s) [Burkholderia sp. MR1]SAL24167.1 diguanylate cyclase/phosphodiesterase with PAS/PAC sensor(s) [Caballeronia concitans]